MKLYKKDIPLVSFCIFAYNQEKFIADAIKGAFSQDYENLEIIISDDCSTDKTYEIMKTMAEIYKGKHKIILNHNDHNLGIREHVNKVLYEIAKGDYILLAGGDDVSAPNRTATYVDIFLKFPYVTSISCLSEEVDENLSLIDSNIFDTDWDNSISIFTLNDYGKFSNFILYSGDSRGLSRTVIKSFPKLENVKSEDIFLFFRSLLVGSGCFIRTGLVKRRHHNCNASSNLTSKSYLQTSFTQMKNDVEYAYKKNYISELKYEVAIDKVRKINEYFELYWTSPYSSIKVFFYRLLKKLFKVVKN